jgi:hypothetical protein
MKATVIWIDDRTDYFEGQVLAEDGRKYYFNYSTSAGKPSRGQWVTVILDTESRFACVFVTELLNLEFKGVI